MTFRIVIYSPKQSTFDITTAMGVHYWSADDAIRSLYYLYEHDPYFRNIEIFRYVKRRSDGMEFDDRNWVMMTGDEYGKFVGVISVWDEQILNKQRIQMFTP